MEWQIEEESSINPTNYHYFSCVILFWGQVVVTVFFLVVDIALSLVKQVNHRYWSSWLKVQEHADIVSSMLFHNWVWWNSLKNCLHFNIFFISGIRLRLKSNNFGNFGFQANLFQTNGEGYAISPYLWNFKKKWFLLKFLECRMWKSRGISSTLSN